MNISTVSEKTDLSTDTLRYYEKVGLIPPVNRTLSGLRDYGEADLQWIEYIKCMRSAGISIEQLVKYVELFQGGDKTIEARKAILREQRETLAAKIAELQQTLAMLDYKIGAFDSRILEVEHALTQMQPIVEAPRGHITAVYEDLNHD